MVVVSLGQEIFVTDKALSLGQQIVGHIFLAPFLNIKRGLAEVTLFKTNQGTQ